MTNDSLLELMARFVSGGDHSIAIAGENEVGLAEGFGEREPFATLSLALASYRPGGGEYLYDEEQIVSQVSQAMQQLIAELQTNEEPAPR